MRLVWRIYVPSFKVLGFFLSVLRERQTDTHTLSFIYREKRDLYILARLAGLFFEIDRTAKTVGLSFNVKI